MQWYCQFVQISHKYVLLETFSTDPLENEFGMLRQGPGGTYFVHATNYKKGEHIQGFFIAIKQCKR